MRNSGLAETFVAAKLKLQKLKAVRVDGHGQNMDISVGRDVRNFARPKEFLSPKEEVLQYSYVDRIIAFCGLVEAYAIL